MCSLVCITDDLRDTCGAETSAKKWCDSRRDCTLGNAAKSQWA